MKRGTLIVGLFLVGLLVLTGCAGETVDIDKIIPEEPEEYCGDSICQDDESCSTCTSDCEECITSCSEDSDCKNDEVCLDNICQESAFTIIFVPNAINDEDDFEEAIEKHLEIFIRETPLSECPEKVRVHTLNVCCEEGEDAGDCIYEHIPEYDGAVMLHPFEVWDEDCSAISGKPKSGSTSVALVPMEHYGTTTHELGHSLGLWDQYCYVPHPDNPNPVDFEEAECEEVTDPDDWFYKYCNRIPGQKPTIYVTPYHCKGNLNSEGGRSIMAGSFGWDKETYGFTDDEYDYLKTKLKCEK